MQTSQTRKRGRRRAREVRTTLTGWFILAGLLILWSATGSVVAMVLGDGIPGPDDRVLPEGPAGPVQPGEVIRIGVLANRGEAIAHEEWDPTVAYLNRTLAPARFVIIPLDFNATPTAVKRHDVSFIAANPSLYTYLEYFGLAQRIATLQVPGDPDPQAVFGGVIITRADRDEISSLRDIRGKRFAAVDPNSLGGWHAAWAVLLTEGIRPEEDLASLDFLATHDAVVMAVLSGAADAGTIRSSQLERMEKEGLIHRSDIRILHDQKERYPAYPYLLSTDLYPEWPFAMVTGTDHALSRDVAVALLMMDANDPAAVAVHGAGWAVPQDHTRVHELLRQLQFPPYETYGKPTIREVINQYWQTILGIIAGILILSFLLAYTWRTKRTLSHALIRITESEAALRRSAAELEELNGTLSRTQERITDSIRYARMIQQSILPLPSDLTKNLAGSFTHLQPLDIVGGDYYFLEETEDGFFIGTVDCTGHGVPGALMTMMSAALISRIIEAAPDITPAALLHTLHSQVQGILRTDTGSGFPENGLDIALCRVYPAEGRLIFAGAGLPLIISRNREITWVPGDRVHLGFSSVRREIVFTDHAVETGREDRVYLITDGILDLPGGEQGYGLGRTGLLDLLTQTARLPLQEQKEELLSQLTVYQGQWPSRDDLTIIGFVIRRE